MLERIGDNDYKMELPGTMNMSTIFNVGDLGLYVDNDFADLRADTSQEEEDDAY